MFTKQNICVSLWIICDFLQMLFILTWACFFQIYATKTTTTGATVKRIHTVVPNTESWSLSWSNVWWIINQTHYGKAVFTKSQPLYFEFLSQPVRAVHEERCARADGHKTTCSFSREEKNERLSSMLSLLQQNEIMTNIYVTKLYLFFHVWGFTHQQVKETSRCHVTLQHLHVKPRRGCTDMGIHSNDTDCLSLCSWLIKQMVETFPSGSLFQDSLHRCVKKTHFLSSRTTFVRDELLISLILS